MRKKSRLLGVIIFLSSALGCWLCYEILKLKNGLPIDDAYIYKRYALNLASGYGFSFNPGEPSFGCSSFLWPNLLAGLVRIFGKDHYLALAQWAGILLTAGSIWFFLKLLSQYTNHWLMILAGAFFAWLHWDIFMNALSGMENGLFSFLIMFNIYFLERTQTRTWKRAFEQGILAGLLFLTRPEGLYFLLAISVLFGYQFLREDRRALFRLGIYLLGFFLLAGPYLVWAERTFHQWGPYTYLAKIYSSYPAFLTRPVLQKIGDGLAHLLIGWSLLLRPWKLVGIILFVFTLLGIFYFFFRYLFKLENASLVVFGGWFFLPFGYGYSFPVSPYFGGYYQRYIASVWLVSVLLGLITMDKFYQGISSRANFLRRFRGAIYALGLILCLIYCRPIVSGGIKEAKHVYVREVKLNTELRLEAANWLNQNTPAQAKILVGYTGLGVVGGECNRYIYDLGALINLDIIPYLKGSVPLSEKRWKRILQYICDREIDYYVDFAPVFGTGPGKSPFRAPDPGKSPGVNEVIRLGVQGEPTESYQQIRIYQIDRKILCAPEAN